MTADKSAGARAVRSALAAGLRSDLCLARVAGADQDAFFQRVLAGDIGALAAGTALPTALLTNKGRVVATMDVLRDAAGLSLLLERSSAASTLAHLERYTIVDDVSMSMTDRAIVGVYGPQLRRIEQLGELARLAPYQHCELTLLGAQCLAMADDRLAVPGALLCCAPAAVEGLLQRLASVGALPLFAAGVEVCRVEAGTPKMGAELTEDVMILEAGQLARVSFDKGCYIGQEPVCRVHNRGRVQRMLVGIQIAGDRVPSAGEQLTSEQKSDAGRVTSAVWSPSLDRVVGLAYVHRSVAEVGSEIVLAGGGVATVTGLPHSGPLAEDNAADAAFYRPRTQPSYESR